MTTKKKPPPVIIAPPQAPLPTRAELLAREAASLERQMKITKRLIAAKKSRDRLLDFTRFTMPDPVDVDDTDLSLFEVSWHHQAICELLEKVEKGLVHRAIITMPPRHAKSELVSRRFLPWVMGRDPSRQTIFATYGADFAEDFGRKAREIIDMPQYRQIFPRVALKKTSRASDRMETEAGGMMVWLGVGGPATGRGAHFLVLDDPFKNREEAESLAHRNKVWDWFTSVAYTRLMPAGVIVIVLTRWHEDDIVGRIFNPDYVPEEEAKKWYLLNLPAIIEEGQENERALWPQRYPLEVLRSTKAFIGERDWNALYQQRPTPPEGAFFKQEMLHTYTREEMPSSFRVYMTGDLALTENSRNDETCAGVWLLDEKDNLYLHPDLYWARKSADASVEKLIDMMKMHEPMATWWEKGQIDRAVGPFFKKRMAEREVYSWLTALPVSGDKGARASAIRGRMSMGKVFFPKFASWWPRAKDQLLKFTGSGDDAEDDFCDMLALIGQALGGQIKADKHAEKKDNVIRVGTLAWVKHDSDFRRQQDKRRAARKGF